MDIVYQDAAAEKSRLLEAAKTAPDFATGRRMMAMARILNGESQAAVARSLGYAPSAVSSIAKRYRTGGIEGLYDGRRHNGRPKVTEEYRARLLEIVHFVPSDFDWERTTWTRELLACQMTRDGFTKVSPATMGRALASTGVKLKSPKPSVLCPWAKDARESRLKQIDRIITRSPANEPVYFQDEVDIHLNPRIGKDWMPPGQRRVVITPGQNEKRYLAGALDARTGELVWTEGDKKASWLFCNLLRKLAKKHPDAPAIHLVVDNYCIHSSKVTTQVLEDELGDRIRLHFLPPYCPDHNRIERVWRDLHDNVTRNHRCRTMSELMVQVRRFLRAYNQRHVKNPSLRECA
jgi:transposase